MSAPTELDVAAELRLVPTFERLTKEALGALTLAATQRRVLGAVSLIEQGMVSGALVVLIRGSAKMVRSERVALGGRAKKNGREVSSKGGASIVLDVMRAPSIVPDPSIVDGHPASFSVVTLRASHAIFIERRAFTKAMAVHPPLASALLHCMTEEVRSQAMRIDQIAHGAADERVLHLFDNLAELYGAPLGQGRFIAIPLRRKDIASMVNATTETVSRLLAKFEREGQARSTRDGIWWKTRSLAPRS